MSDNRRLYTPVQGKTYSLFADNGDSEGYYSEIKRLADLFLDHRPGERELLRLIQDSGRKTFFERLKLDGHDREILRFVRENLGRSLSGYTPNVRDHLKSLPLAKRLDNTLATTEYKYHLYMLEIELINRIYKEDFKRSRYKFALIAHCLRDFRPECRSAQGDIEAACRRCTDGCLVNLAGAMLERYGVKPYISVERDQEKLFRNLKHEHESIGALGIACVPELARGMRLCVRTGISPIGIPLNANRCARWMSRPHETSFNLERLESLLM